MKRCFSTLGCTERDLDGIIQTAHKFQIPFLEIRGMDGALDNRCIPTLTPERLPDVKARLADTGLRVQVIGASASFHDPKGREDALAEATYAIDVAAALGAPYIRVFGNSIGDDPDGSIRSAIEGLKKLVEIAESRNVTVLLETHGDFRDEKTLIPVLDALSGHPGFGLIWDVMHTYFTTGRDFLPLYRELYPHIRHIHFKDCTKDRRLVLPGEGDIPLSDILKQLQRDRFDGCISLEWERKWNPDLPPIEQALIAMNKFLQPLGL